MKTFRINNKKLGADHSGEIRKDKDKDKDLLHDFNFKAHTLLLL